MNHLNSCPQCNSFNPAHISTCLNCDTKLTQASSGSAIKRALKTAGVVAISMTLTACYGAPDYPACVDEDLDGFCNFEDCDDNNSEVDTGENCDEQTPLESNQNIEPQEP